MCPLFSRPIVHSVLWYQPTFQDFEAILPYRTLPLCEAAYVHDGAADISLSCSVRIWWRVVLHVDSHRTAPVPLSETEKPDVEDRCMVGALYSVLRRSA